VEPVVDIEKTDQKFDGVILSIVHKIFEDIPLNKLRRVTNNIPVLTDVKGHFCIEKAMQEEFIYRKL